MRRPLATTLLALACAAALAGCRAGTGSGAAAPGGESVEAVIRQLRDFTEELASKVETAPDTKAGVGEAQRLLDARKAELASRIGALKRDALKSDPSARGKWLEAEVDSTGRVRGLQVKYLDASLRDPELKAGLERLAADYDSLFEDR
jgi:hypothetical protein